MIGVILANTGSPASCEPDDIERYLRDYLMDDRIRQLPKPVWKWLLHRHILPKRKHSSAKRYEFIWTEGGSPLVENQAVLAAKVQALFDAGGGSQPGGSQPGGDGAVEVLSAMSYGTPNVRDALIALREHGADHVILMPLYPQSAYSPTLAVVDSFHRALDDIAWRPPYTVIDNYHDDPGYIGAMVDSIRNVGFDPSADRLLFSFHAIPLKDERAGDTYRAQIAESTRLIAEGLGIDAQDATVAFQSVFGHDPSAWTAPLAHDILAGWRDGDFRVVYACPGFSVDCLETLYDIPHEMVPALEGEGAQPVVDRTSGDVQASCNTGGRFVWVPSLNTSDAHARLIKGVLDRNLPDGRA